ncbi:MAG: PSD1 domain-containing protein, partial [Planctomycetales bacterium]|nr:PSD1 domain-containing protein [Planctomycetales bacterium]
MRIASLAIRWFHAKLMRFPAYAAKQAAPRDTTILLTPLIAFLWLAQFDAVAASDPVDFVRDIRPLLMDHCFACHGSENQEGGLRLDIRTRALEGGDSGPAILAGQPHKSTLLARIARVDADTAMPPEGEGKPLSEAEVELFHHWIQQGVQWPAADTALERSTHWAFQPIERSPIPTTVGPSARHPVDVFIHQRLSREGISPSDAADRATLLRRLSFDLLGLPPSPAEVETFLNDDAPLAYERLVDRLLASPHYGERWAKHWLDLARYADTDGYSGEKFRPWAWRWRHWVIDALNDDMPFDQFTIEQLAGDLLPDATIEQRVATGFHRNYLHTREMDADTEEFRVRKIVDCANVTGIAWLGLTFGCAECHSHKFDPISQREYYGLYAFFNSTEEIDLPAPLKTVAMIPPPSPGAAGANAERANTERADGSAEEPPPEPKPVMAQTLSELANPRPTHVHLRGNFLARGPAVTPHTLAVLPPLDVQAERPSRLDLAHWLVSHNHPLTSRVSVNRIWQHLFGRGLVRTENDFGTQGSPPTHPKLLDWLALELMNCGWSQKELIRLIVTSETYRQSSAARPDLVERDADNRLLARQNRLRHEAEILRDAAFFAAGGLDLRVGGPSFRPAVSPDAGAVVSTQWKPDAGSDQHRRGLYIVVQRTIPLPYLMMFDAPDGNAFCTRR